MNITLIGMSGVGKSTIGRKLAEELEYEFIDVDKNIESSFKKPLQDILDELGDEKFMENEETEVLALDLTDDLVLAPGGSIIYSPKAMEYLKQHTKIIYLYAPALYIQSKITPSARGIVGLSRKTYNELHTERHPMYEKASSYVIDIQSKETPEILMEIKQALQIP